MLTVRLEKVKFLHVGKLIWNQKREELLRVHL